MLYLANRHVPQANCLTVWLRCFQFEQHNSIMASWLLLITVPTNAWSDMRAACNGHP